MDLISAKEFGTLYFDIDFYLSRYPDIKSSGQDALYHWLQHGFSEGRTPHPLFDPEFYVRQRPEIPIASALKHYFESGWKEGALPSPLLSKDAQSSLPPTKNPQPVLTFLSNLLKKNMEIDFDDLSTLQLAAWGFIADSPLQTLRDYVLNGWNVRIPRECWELISKIDYANDEAWDAPPFSFPINTKTKPICILLTIGPVLNPPVVRSIQQICKLWEKATEPDDSLLVMLDGVGKTDSEFIEQLLQSVPNHLIFHEHISKGFVKGINKLSQSAPETHDLVWVNSDVVIFEKTFSILRSIASRHPSAASVTAISNAGSLLSYPFPNKEHRLTLGLTPASQAQEFERLCADITMELPTGIGHCMWLRRSAWTDVGLLNEDMFDSGYGEENDWSFRAVAQGWNHLAAIGAFVWHHGAASFGNAKRDERKRNAIEILQRLHPDSMQSLHSDMTMYEQDLKNLYVLLDSARIAHKVRQTPDSKIVIAHSSGGGVHSYIANEKRYDPKKDVLIVLDRETPTFVLHSEGIFTPNVSADSQKIYIDRLDLILKNFGDRQIEVHSMAGADPLAISRGLTNHTSRLSLYLHDFLTICPRINLLGGAEHSHPQYCGAPKKPDACVACIAKHGTEWAVNDIVEWRTAFSQLTKMTNKVHTPSKAAAKILGTHGIRADVLDVRPLSLNQDSLRFSHRKLRETSGLVDRTPKSAGLDVLVIGAIGYPKGASVVAEVATVKRSIGRNWRLGLLGKFDENFGPISKVFDVNFGEYSSDSNLDWIPTPRLVWLPSIWPETHMYTIDDAIRLFPNSPVIVFSVNTVAVNRLKELKHPHKIIENQSAPLVAATLSQFLGD